MILIEDYPLSHSYRHRKIEENDKGNKRNEQKPKYIHPNMYIHSKQRQKTRDKKKKKKNHRFAQEKKKTKGNPEARKSIDKGKKGFEEIGEPLVRPRDQRKKYWYTMQALNAHGAGRRRTKPNGSQSKGEQPLLQGPQMRMRMRHRQKGRRVMISSVNRKSVQYRACIINLRCGSMETQ